MPARILTGCVPCVTPAPADNPVVPTFRTTRRVRHSPAQMFDLVADVEKYPLFVPLCEELHILRRTQSGEGIEVLVADMRVGYKAIAESFTSRVTLDRPRLKILVEYIDGPFSDLQNRWTFQPDNSGCVVEFYIAYEFRSRTLGLLMGAMFDRAFRKFAEAFEQRADIVYGVPGIVAQPSGT
jgi:coenzyme Q-binding protein COQ10